MSSSSRRGLQRSRSHTTREIFYESRVMEMTTNYVESRVELCDYVDSSYLAIPTQDKLYGTVKGVEHISEKALRLDLLRSQYNTSWQVQDGMLMVVTAYPNGMRPKVAFFVITKISNTALRKALEEIHDSYCESILLMTRDQQWKISNCAHEAELRERCTGSPPRARRDRSTRITCGRRSSIRI